MRTWIKSTSLLRTTLFIVAAVPLGAYFLVKPTRVVMPEWFGVVCPTAQVCVEDLQQFPVAKTLHAEAQQFVTQRLGSMDTSPRVIFCSTDVCAVTFGLGARSAVTLGTWGTVIGPRAWKPYYVRHEMIHVLQAERLGVLGLLRKPAWFKEGMAYGLSEDPREPLNEPFEAQRNAFRQWHQSIDPTTLWAAADAL